MQQFILMLLALCASPALAQTRALLVGNEGADSPSCGSSGAPSQGEPHKCRSISQAIRNAADGDTVFVEAGVYGDLNRNGIIGEPGEESGGEAGGSWCQCLILVDKRVTVLSERGAAATIIDTARTSLSGVYVVGEGAAFGYTGMGFTVLVASQGQHGILLRVPGTIAGNRVIGLVHELDFEGPWFGMGLASFAAGADIYDNEVSGFGYGIWAFASRIARNAVTRNRVGLFTGNSDPYEPIRVYAPTVVEDNVIADNVIGIDIRHGVGVLPITGNDVLHNKLTGIWRYSASHQTFINPDIVIQDNNLIGNGHGNPLGNCGLTNDSYGAIWAANNYWGGNNWVCNGVGSSTQTDPIRLQPDGRVSD